MYMITLMQYKLLGAGISSEFKHFYILWNLSVILGQLCLVKYHDLLIVFISFTTVFNHSIRTRGLLRYLDARMKDPTLKLLLGTKDFIKRIIYPTKNM